MSEALPDIRGFLLSDATISGAVGHGSPLVYGVYPYVLDEAAPLPAITYQIVSLTEDHLLEGPSIGVNHARFQIDCWANSYADMDALSWAVRNLFDGYAGPMGEVSVAITLHEQVIDQYEPSRRQYRRVLDFIVIFYDF